MRRVSNGSPRMARPPSLQPDAPEEEVDAYITTLRDLITASGGAVEKEEKWGKRKLPKKSSSF